MHQSIRDTFHPVPSVPAGPRSEQGLSTLLWVLRYETKCERGFRFYSARRIYGLSHTKITIPDLRPMKLTKRKRVRFSIDDIRSSIIQQPHSLAPTHFDLNVDPYTFKQLATSYPFSPSLLSQSATSYPVSKLCVVIRPLPSISIVVSVEEIQYISIGQLLRTLHYALQVRVTETDWAHLTEWEQMIVAKAFYDRCEASADYYGSVFDGVKRIDFLCGDTQFQGITPSSKWAHTWDLVLRKRRRPPAPPPIQRKSSFNKWYGM